MAGRKEGSHCHRSAATSEREARGPRDSARARYSTPAVACSGERAPAGASGRCRGSERGVVVHAHRGRWPGPRRRRRDRRSTWPHTARASDTHGCAWPPAAGRTTTTTNAGLLPTQRGLFARRRRSGSPPLLPTRAHTVAHSGGTHTQPSFETWRTPAVELVMGSTPPHPGGRLLSDLLYPRQRIVERRRRVLESPGKKERALTRLPGSRCRRGKIRVKGGMQGSGAEFRKKRIVCVLRQDGRECQCRLVEVSR